MRLSITFASRKCGAAIALLLLTTTGVRADLIGYDYNFLTPTSVTGDVGNLGAVNFATTAGGHATGHAVVTAASLAVVTAAPPATPDTFSGQSYSLALQLTDGPSGKASSLIFTGKLFGVLTAQDVNITTSFDPPTKQLVLGKDIYTVTISPLQLDPNPTVVGTLLATVDVQANSVSPPPVAQVPEPSAFVLAALGLLAFRRRAVAMQAPTTL